MLTVPLGAALTADSVFSDESSEDDDSKDLNSPFHADKAKGVDNPHFQVKIF